MAAPQLFFETNDTKMLSIDAGVLCKWSPMLRDLFADCSQKAGSVVTLTLPFEERVVTLCVRWCTENAAREPSLVDEGTLAGWHRRYDLSLSDADELFINSLETTQARGCFKLADLLRIDELMDLAATSIADRIQETASVPDGSNARRKVLGLGPLAASRPNRKTRRSQEELLYPLQSSHEILHVACFIYGATFWENDAELDPLMRTVFCDTQNRVRRHLAQESSDVTAVFRRDGRWAAERIEFLLALLRHPLVRAELLDNEMCDVVDRLAALAKQNPGIRHYMSALYQTLPIYPVMGTEALRSLFKQGDVSSLEGALGVGGKYRLRWDQTEASRLDPEAFAADPGGLFRVLQKVDFDIQNFMFRGPGIPFDLDNTFAITAAIVRGAEKQLRDDAILNRSFMKKSKIFYGVDSPITVSASEKPCLRSPLTSHPPVGPVCFVGSPVAEDRRRAQSPSG
jgi:hypothetical protein